MNRKLTQLDDDATDAINGVKSDMMYTTAHSYLAETVKHMKRETDATMDYFSIVMDTYRPQQGVLTRAQAAAAGFEPT